MADKRILVANADPKALAEIGSALGEDWNVTLVASSASALTEMAMHPFDALIADFDLPEIDGAELLDRIHKDYSKTVRILIVGEVHKDRMMAEVQGAHQVLVKPCDQLTLKRAVECALAIDVWLANDSLRELVGRLRTFPIVPSLYLEVVNALRSPNATTEEVGNIIAKDMAMMTKLLQVTNSACFGLPRKISDPVEAVGILGFETVKSMVMTLKLLSQYDKVKPVYFSIDRLWRHSTEVARIAKRIMFAQTEDPVLAEAAYTAGLMHDLGKLVLASNFDDQYSGAQALAKQQQIPLWEVEKQIFGANHAEIGAYLLGLWGMPLDLVEAAALHHTPARCLTLRFTSLTAVHAANALFHEAVPEKDGFVPAKLDDEYLGVLGVIDKLPAWREIVQSVELNPADFRSRTGNTMFISKRAAAEAKPTTKPAQPAPPKAKPARSWTLTPRQWIFTGLGATACVAAFWIGGQALIQSTIQPPAEQASRPATNQTVATAPAPVVAPVVETPKPAEPVVASPAVVEQPKPVVATPIPPAKPSSHDLAFADLRLQSIFFSDSNPVAIISGRRVQTDDHLASGAQVVKISPSSVTLEFENERRTLALK